MKKIIRITESDLHNIIKESVKKVLREGIDGYPEAGMPHYAMASQNSIDNGYEYEGELHSEFKDGYIVSKYYEQLDDVLYNIEDDENDKLVFPEWFTFTKGENNSWIDDDNFYATINGKNYIANWITGQLKPIG